MPLFIPGRELSRRFFEERIRPLIAAHAPQLRYSAALIGPGSDVLGFDTELSTDHDWGPRLLLFLDQQDLPVQAELHSLFCRELPQVFYGFPVSITQPDDGQPDPHAQGVPDHRVVITTLHSFVNDHLAYVLDQPLTAADWLTFPSQILRELTSGSLHYDGTGELSELRQRLAWYPHDVWLYLLAAGWNRIGQEEHLMPRAGSVGDELGSALIGSRLVRDIMSLCFLYERQYAPYPKWFGSAFQQLASSSMTPVLQQAQHAPSWQEREQALNSAYSALAQLHNRAAITRSLPESPSFFYTRPFQVIQGGMFAEAIRNQISDPAVARIAQRQLIGNIDQISDNTDIRASSEWRAILRALYL